MHTAHLAALISPEDTLSICIDRGNITKASDLWSQMSKIRKVESELYHGDDFMVRPFVQWTALGIGHLTTGQLCTRKPCTVKFVA